MSPYPRTVDGRFDLDAYLAQYRAPEMRELLDDPEGRRVLTRLDPLLFALCYVPRHLKDPAFGNGEITFAEFHISIVQQALEWIRRDTEPAQSRDAYVAPRGIGKSTWLFLILPLWAAAHGHRKFIAAFADSADMARRHLGTFKREIEENQLLRTDFPDLCSPARRANGSLRADRMEMYHASNDFVFIAKGIDSNALGLKVDERRPDLLILDDIEPDEKNYSADQKEQRLNTVLATVFPMNVYARVIISGTVTMPGSIIHDLVKTARKMDDSPDWVRDEKIRCHWYPIVVTDEVTGEERPLWPAKYPMKYIIENRHTRHFRSQMMNDPMAVDGAYWVDTDFTHRDDIKDTHCILSIDPAVTSKKKSDFTALVVVGFNRELGVCVLRDAWALRIQPGEPLRQRVIQILDQYPMIAGIVIETNQGGDTWKAILHGMPCPVKTVHQSAPKEIRAGSLLTKYQRSKVFHAKPLPALEEQMVAFPKGANDDLVDAAGTGVTVFLKDDKPKRDNTPRSASYI
ncbi:hypothetical protein AB0383_20575 [Amycolatopsis sp. NPDC051373]|uniref:hypothetical protein n=1 Tax=Amycolatopsis sp. NPDC051373 TaxID=3155801 RepID=UPI00344DC016